MSTKTTKNLLSSLILFSAILPFFSPELIHPNPQDKFSIDKMPGVFSVEKAYFYVKPTREIFSGVIADPQSSSNSKYIAFAGDPNVNQNVPYISSDDVSDYNLGPNQGIYLYNVSNKSNQLIFKYSPDRYKLEELKWIHLSELLFFSMLENQTTRNYIFNARTNKIQEIPTCSYNSLDTVPYYIENSNSLVYEISLEEDASNSYITVLYPQTTEWKLIKIPNNEYNIISDGKRLLLSGYNQSLKKDTWQEFNLSNGEIIEHAHPPDFDLFEVQDTYLLDQHLNELRVGEMEFHEPTDEIEVSLKIENSVVVGHNSFFFNKSPDETLVFFVNRSGLHVAEIIRFKQSDYANFEKEYFKQKTIAQAKEVGLAIIIYASDYDDVLPRSSDWKETVLPYIKSGKNFEDFSYLLNDIYMPDFEDVGSTVLGQIETPHGTTTIFLNLKVVWKDRPKALSLK